MGFYFADWSSVGRLSDNYQIEGGTSIMKWGSALIIIMYAYSGWNGTTYIAGEIRNPEKNLPRALFLGTLLITVIYLAMNVIYLMSAPGEVIMTDGKYTICALAATNLFGPKISPIFDACIVVIFTFLCFSADDDRPPFFFCHGKGSDNFQIDGTCKPEAPDT